MAEDEAQTVTCPHCRREFVADLLQGDTERHRGYKCPHCRLFVPLERVEQPSAESSAFGAPG
jgi:DNA-directed RNA polymerase subunit RPC12/RpoP